MYGRPNLFGEGLDGYSRVRSYIYSYPLYCKGLLPNLSYKLESDLSFYKSLVLYLELGISSGVLGSLVRLGGD